MRILRRARDLKYFRYKEKGRYGQNSRAMRFKSTSITTLGSLYIIFIISRLIELVILDIAILVFGYRACSIRAGFKK
jgi:hypothetical protein